MRGKLANVDLHLQSSTKRILSLVKTLPDGDHLALQLQTPSKTTAKEAPRRRFNRHPRLLSSKPSSQISNESDVAVPSLVVLKKPIDAMALTDSSDEYCDVTIRKDPLDPVVTDDNDISDQILESVQNRLAMKNQMKMETKDIKNAVNSQKDFVKGDCKGDSKVTKGPCKEKRQKLRGKSAVDVGSGDRRWAEKNYRTDKVERTRDAPKIFLNLKLRSIIEKSLTTLDDIRVLMEYGVDPPDGSEDYDRRKKRATEFTTRFSRIHLYQLNRHITDIQNILLPTSDRSGGQKFNLDLNQRFYTAHQTIFQGLQAYKKHLPSTVVIGVPDKFGEFLKCTSSLCDILRNNYDENPCLKGDQCIIDVLEVKCNVLYDDMQERRLMATPILKNGDSRISLTGNCYKKPLKIKPRDSRYSMYQTVPKGAYWKKAIAALARKKFNVSSKYKTATYKHRPQPVQQQRPFPSQEVFKSSKSEPRKKSASKTINDMDRNVETQLQMQPQEDDDAEKLSFGDNHVMWNIAQEIFEKIGKEQTMSQKEYECILEHFISMVKHDKTDTKTGVHMEDEVQQLLEERLGKPIEKMEFKEFTDKLIECLNGDENRKPPEPEAKIETGDGNGRAVSDANLSSKSGTGVKERRQTISVTGLKNAQLICIKDETSFEETNEEDAKKNSTHDLTHKESKKSIEDKVPSKGKLIRVQKSKQNLRQLEMLPKETMVDIIQYKLQFHKETKNNYMYKKSGNMSPWILMERIADKLLEESLYSIARDIQVDEILRKVFSQEFK